jgi:hypothetical protein
MMRIKSRDSDRELLFNNLKGDQFQVELKGSQITAVVTVYAYTGAHGLKKLLQELGKFDRPWIGAKQWRSLEGEFSISATCDKLGHVFFEVEIRTLPGHPEESYVKAGLTTDFGNLALLAKDAEAFFSH